VEELKQGKVAEALMKARGVPFPLAEFMIELFYFQRAVALPSGQGRYR
jgi:hypothetical protein